MSRVGNLVRRVARRFVPLPPPPPPPRPWPEAISLTGRDGPFENLLPVGAYTAQPVWNTIDESLLVEPLERAVARDTFPLPATGDREGYHDDRHYEHWQSGLRDYLFLVRRLGARGIRLSPGNRVLELGCASGRVLRHFLCQSPGLELWGADINLRNVEWVRRFLDPSIRVFQCTVLPHLPLEDRSMDLVYAFSVFTHIDAFELAWLLELRRVLRPGGVAYLTVHTDRTWGSLDPTSPLHGAILGLAHLYPERRLGPESFSRPMEGERLVFADTASSVYNVNIFHSTDYLRSTWGRFFDILDIHPAGADYQDVVVLQKR